MNINRNNYEAFFLDYHEGNLSPEQVAELLLFVEMNPELREEFEGFENITLYDLSAVSFDHKSDLKKEITDSNREEYFIAAAEGTLNLAETQMLSDFLKQHPLYAAELDLFKKTILHADTSLVYENKHELKRAAIITSTDELLISAVEGLLSPEENNMLKKQLSVDAGLQHEFSLYQQTKVLADEDIVYENKAELKRNKKVVPIFWYVSGVAAAVLLLIGLFFVFKTTQPVKENNFANSGNPGASENKQGTANRNALQNTVVPENNSVAVNDGMKNQPGVSRKKRSNEKDQDKNQSPVRNPKLPVIEQQKDSPLNLANTNGPENKQPELNKNEVPVVADNLKPEKDPSTNEQPAIVGLQNPDTRTQQDYLTLKEFAAKKIKEKTLDENSVAVQKSNGRLKRFSGWDLAQIVTRGISKLTGRDLEVKPKYNEEGEVTAYALGNAFEVTRGR